MSKINGNDLVYPCSEIVSGGMSQARQVDHKGMSLRTRLAESAMKGLLAADPQGACDSYAYVSCKAVKHADALIAELEKTGDQ